MPAADLPAIGSAASRGRRAGTGPARGPPALGPRPLAPAGDQPNTVARVYTELEREGILNTRPGLGVFVARPKAELTRKVRKERFEELVDHFLTEAVHLGFRAEEVLAMVSARAKQFQWQSQRRPMRCPTLSQRERRQPCLT